MLHDKLHASLGQHLHVGDIWGHGLFIGLVMVADRQTKAPFAPAHGIAASNKKHAMQAGLICYPAQCTIDGGRGDHEVLTLPFIIAEAEMDLLVERLGYTITEAVG